MFRNGFLLLFFASLLVFSGCGKDDPDKIAERDRQKLLNYIAANELDAQEHSSGLFYVIEKPGTGAQPTLSSLIRMNYKGMLLDGKTFDFGTGVDFNLQNTIRGWQIGVPMFRAGGKGMLLVPSALGYGSFAMGGIPRNSCLIFEIEILDVI